MVFVITAQTKKDSQAAHTDFTRSVYMESDTQPDNQTVLNKWKQKYGDDVDENTLEIEPLKDMDADKLRAGGLEVSKICSPSRKLRGRVHPSFLALTLGVSLVVSRL